MWDETRDPWRALTALIFGYFMVILDMAIVAVSNPEITQRLHADISQVVWATSAYLLAFATLLLPAGRLGDLISPKTVYLTGLGVFTAASLWCGWSPTIGTLIAARAVQGVGAALVTPQTMAVITRIFPPERRTAAMSLWGGVAGLANLLGPLLGGVLVDWLGWQWIFFVNVPIGVVGFVLAVRFVPALPVQGHGMDPLGVVLSVIGMSLLVFGLQEGGGAHWNTQIRLVIVAGLVMLTVFIAHQARSRGEPLLPLGMFRDRNFALSNVAVASVGAAVVAVMMPLYFYLETVRTMPGARAALVVAPMAVLAMIVVPVVGRFGDRTHPRAIPVAGFALFAITLACFAAFMTPDSPIGVFLLGAAITGVANACIWPTLAVTATRDLPPHRAGAGAGAYNAIRQVGSVLGSAAIGAVIANRMAAHGLPADDVNTGHALAGAAPDAFRHAFGAALGESLYLPVALLVCGLVASALLVRAGRPATPPRAAETGPPVGEPVSGVGGRTDARPTEI